VSLFKKQKLVAAQLGKDEDGNVVISDTQELSQGDPATSHKNVTAEKRPRAILTFDGVKFKRKHGAQYKNFIRVKCSIAYSRQLS
jgi:hypothetical protein